MASDNCFRFQLDNAIDFGIIYNIFMIFARRHGLESSDVDFSLLFADLQVNEAFKKTHVKEDLT